MAAASKPSNPNRNVRDQDYDRAQRRTWKPKRKVSGVSKNYSVLKKLRREKKISPEFEAMLSRITLEDLIAAKLEVAGKAIGNRLYGMRIWTMLPWIARDATLKYTLSSARTVAEAATFLGKTVEEFYLIRRKFKVTEFFENNKED